MDDVDIPIILYEDASIPHYASEGAAGADVRAHLESEMIIPPGESVLVPTGLRTSIPLGYEIQLRPRSGLALKHQVTLCNTPGTIDSDYRGEIKVIMINHGKNPFIITPGMRVAQMIVAPVVRANFCVVEDLVETVRGAGGFGHTGVH